jgi:hypothetical protein
MDKHEVKEHRFPSGEFPVLPKTFGHKGLHSEIRQFPKQIWGFSGTWMNGPCTSDVLWKLGTLKQLFTPAVKNGSTLNRWYLQHKHKLPGHTAFTPNGWVTYPTPAKDIFIPYFG